MSEFSGDPPVRQKDQYLFVRESPRIFLNQGATYLVMKNYGSDTRKL